MPRIHACERRHVSLPFRNDREFDEHDAVVFDDPDQQDDSNDPDHREESNDTIENHLNKT
jgi:hypothetical protein